MVDEVLTSSVPQRSKAITSLSFRSLKEDREENVENHGEPKGKK